MKCKAGHICSNGACELSCPFPMRACGNLCANTLSDETNCGACGKKCRNGEQCVMGKCGGIKPRPKPGRPDGPR